MSVYHFQIPFNSHIFISCPLFQVFWIGSFQWFIWCSSGWFIHESNWSG